MAAATKDDGKAQENSPETQLGATPRAAVAGVQYRQREGEREAKASDLAGPLRMGTREYPTWTPAMVRAIQSNREQGKRWHLLIDKVGMLKNLREAWKWVAANKGSAGVSGQTIEEYEVDLEKRLEALSERVTKGHYHPRPIRRVNIPKADGSGKMRPLGIPEVEDRIVQTAIVLSIEPIFEATFLPCSYGFRPERGALNALSVVDAGLAGKRKWVVDADIKDCFGSIPHDVLMKQVEKHIGDRKLLTLIREFLQAEVIEKMKRWTPTNGAPQGATLSPLLANIHMNVFDEHMISKGYEVVRYADDFVILCETEMEATSALETARTILADIGLTMHPEKTKVVDATKDVFQFLGYVFGPWGRKPRPSSEAKMREAIRAKTRRLDGRSLRVIIRSLNRTLYGWYRYFRHGTESALRSIDQMVRRRLRSILRKRDGRHGASRPGADHQRYPNALFDSLGLFGLLDRQRQERRGRPLIPFPARA